MWEVPKKHVLVELERLLVGIKTLVVGGWRRHVTFKLGIDLPESGWHETQLGIRVSAYRFLCLGLGSTSIPRHQCNYIKPQA